MLIRVPCWFGAKRRDAVFVWSTPMGGKPLDVAVDLFLAHQDEKLVGKMVPELVKHFPGELEAWVSKRYFERVEDELNLFAKIFKGAISEISNAQIAEWQREDFRRHQVAATLTVRGEVAARTPIPERSREATDDERQKWFGGQLAAGKPLRRADLEYQFSISVATAKRDLLALRESVTFDPASKTYRLKKRARADDGTTVVSSTACTLDFRSGALFY